MPPKMDMEFVGALAESFAKGQPYASKIGLIIFRNQVHEEIRKVYSHDAEVA
jgi:pyruvate dehydrogenase (quinone)